MHPWEAGVLVAKTNTQGVFVHGHAGLPVNKISQGGGSFIQEQVFFFQKSAKEKYHTNASERDQY